MRGPTSPRTKENAPSRWRLRPASRLTSAEAGAGRRAINLGYSVLGAVATLRSGDRVVKHSEEESSANSEKGVSAHRAGVDRGQVVHSDNRYRTARPDPGRPRRGRGSCTSTTPVARMIRRESSKENAPSRWRLRPASQLTSAKAGADRRAINLGCSVLGASGTLWDLSSAVKAPMDELLAICAFFFSQWLNCASRRML